MAWLKPIAMNIEEAMIRPVARRDEENQEKNRAINTGSVKKIGEEEERYNESDNVLVYEDRKGDNTRALTTVMHLLE